MASLTIWAPFFLVCRTRREESFRQAARVRCQEISVDEKRLRSIKMTSYIIMRIEIGMLTLPQHSTLSTVLIRSWIDRHVFETCQTVKLQLKRIRIHTECMI